MIKISTPYQTPPLSSLPSSVLLQRVCSPCSSQPAREVQPLLYVWRKRAAARLVRLIVVLYDGYVRNSIPHVRGYDWVVWGRTGVDERTGLRRGGRGRRRRSGRWSRWVRRLFSLSGNFLFHCRWWGPLDPQSLVRGHRLSPALLSGARGSHQSQAGKSSPAFGDGQVGPVGSVLGHVVTCPEDALFFVLLCRPPKREVGWAGPTKSRSHLRPTAICR